MSMKRLVTILIFFQSYLSFSQEEKFPLIFNEFTVAVNRTTIQNLNTNGRFGFGLGLSRTWFDSYWANLVIGLSYDKISFFQKTAYIGHFASYNDITYNLHGFSIPVLGRFNIGKKVKCFLETGLFADFYVSGNRRGTFSSILSGADPNTVTKKEKYGVSGINGGVTVGIGTRIPVKSNELLIKLDYLFSFRELGDGQDNFFNRYIRLSFGFRLLQKG